jgi:hypothetical protein
MNFTLTQIESLLNTRARCVCSCCFSAHALSLLYSYVCLFVCVHLIKANILNRNNASLAQKGE